MWISKRKWNEMEDKIDVLEKRDARLWEEWAKLKVISDGLAMAHISPQLIGMLMNFAIDSTFMFLINS